MSEASISIVKGVCSNCAPAENPPKKICMAVTIGGQQVLLCRECINVIANKMDDVKKLESSGKIQIG